MDFYTNIHKSRGDRVSSIIASSDTVSPFNYSTREKSHKQQKLLSPRQWKEVGGRGQCLLEVFKFIARMMFLISTTAIN